MLTSFGVPAPKLTFINIKFINITEKIFYKTNSRGSGGNWLGIFLVYSIGENAAINASLNF